jgi:carboxymethylenebutenolidase
MKTIGLASLMFFLWLGASPRLSAAAEPVVRAVVLPTGQHPVPATLFTVPGTARRPAVIVLHGRQGLARFQDFYARYATALARAGLDAYLLSYYDATDAVQAQNQDNAVRQAWSRRRIPAWTQLVRASVSAILADAHCSGSVGLLGFSQGGFLAVAAAGQDPRVACLVVFYGGIPTVFQDSLTHLPPLLALHGDADTTVPLAEGTALADLGRRLGAPTEMVVFPGAGHGFSGADALAAENRTVGFLKKQLLERE